MVELQDLGKIKKKQTKLWSYLIPGSGAEFGQLLLDGIQRDRRVGQVEKVHHIMVGREGLEVGGSGPSQKEPRKAGSFFFSF